MRDVTKIDQAIKMLKDYKSDIKKKNKISDKLRDTDIRDISIKRRGNMTADLDWACMNLDKSHKRLWIYMLENFETDTGERTYSPSPFHLYKGKGLF